MAVAVEQQLQTDGGVLLELLTEQRDLYRRLAGQSRRQTALITGDEQEGLLTLLSERQQAIDRLGEVAKELRDYHSDWRMVRQQMAPKIAARVDELLTETNALLAGILEQDEKDVQLLATRKSATAGAMSAARQQRQVGAAYQASNEAGSAKTEWTDE